MSAFVESKLQNNLSQCLPVCDNKNKINYAQLLIKEIKTWIERSRQRKQLARLDEHLLKDIGYSHSQVQKEISKPFWRQ